MSNCTNFRDSHPHVNVYWCYSFKDNDYTQVFIVGFMDLYLQFHYKILSSLVIGLFGNSVTSVAEQIKILKDRAGFAPPSSDVFRLEGWPLKAYVCLTSTQSLLCFVVQVLLLTDPSLNGANHDFTHHSFRSWFSARNIIISFIFSHALFSIFPVFIAAKMEVVNFIGGKTCSSKLLLWCLLVFSANVATEWWLLIAGYGYYVNGLYMSAVVLMLLLPFFCYSCIKVIKAGRANNSPSEQLSLKVSQVPDSDEDKHDNENTNDRFYNNQLRDDCCTKCKKLLNAIMIFAFWQLYGYLFVLGILSVAWLMLGGPPSSIIYVTDQDNIFAIFVLLIIINAFPLIASGVLAFLVDVAVQ